MSTETAAGRLGAGIYALPLEEACIRYGIITPLEKAHFLAQVAVESAGFTMVRESLNYSSKGVLSTFGHHRISAQQAAMYGRRPAHPADQQMLANILYGGHFGERNLGNVRMGDGWKFIGRGLKQVTGRANYTAYSQATYGDDRCVDNPVLLEQLPDAALSAGWFWQSHKIGPLALADDLRAVTQRVNGGENGLNDRARWLAKAKGVFDDMTRDRLNASGLDIRNV